MILAWLSTETAVDPIMVYGVVRLANEHGSEMPTYSLVDLIEEQDISAKVTVRGKEISMKVAGAPR